MPGASQSTSGLPTSFFQLCEALSLLEKAGQMRVPNGGLGAIPSGFDYPALGTFWSIGAAWKILFPPAALAAYMALSAVITSCSKLAPATPEPL